MRPERDATQPVTIDLRKMLLEEAERLQVDVRAACEQGLKEALKKAWLAENRPAIDAWNAYVEEHGLPLARERDAVLNSMRKR